jgi:hypothetical protein
MKQNLRWLPALGWLALALSPTGAAGASTPAPVILREIDAPARQALSRVLDAGARVDVRLTEKVADLDVYLRARSGGARAVVLGTRSRHNVGPGRVRVQARIANRRVAESVARRHGILTIEVQIHTRTGYYQSAVAHVRLLDR